MLFWSLSACSEMFEGDRAGDRRLQSSVQALVQCASHQFSAMALCLCHLDGFAVDEQHFVLIDGVMQRSDELAGKVKVEFGRTSIIEHRIHTGPMR